MASDHNAYDISKELTGLFRMSKEDVSEDAGKRIDSAWNGLQAIVEEINKAVKGESTRIDLKDTDPKDAVLLAERAAFRRLNQILTEAVIEDGTIEQDDLKRYLQEQLNRGIDLTDSEIFKKGLKLCTDDELLYEIAKNAPQNRLFSFGDVAASMITSEEYRYAMIGSSIKGRKTLIHDLAIKRELDEMLAIRILLVDSNSENKRESLYVIKDEALLMLAWLKSFSYKTDAKEQLKKIGSDYPEHFFEMEQDEKDAVLKDWHARAREYAERLIDMDKMIKEKIDSSICINSSLLIGFLALCHPEHAKRIKYASMITSERLAFFVGSLTEYDDIKEILASKIHDKDLFDCLPYYDFLNTDGYESENFDSFSQAILKKPMMKKYFSI